MFEDISNVPKFINAHLSYIESMEMPSVQPYFDRLIELKNKLKIITMENQTHKFELSTIGFESSGFQVTVTSEDLLEMYHHAKKNQQAHPDVDFFDLCRGEAIVYVANFTKENYPLYFDIYDGCFHDEHCTYEMASCIENALGEVSEREEMEEMEEKLKDKKL
jgi:hypothetical protein